MCSSNFSVLATLCFLALVAACAADGPACVFTAPSSCGLSQDMVMHLGLEYMCSECTVKPATLPAGGDPHAGHDMRRRLANMDDMDMYSWACDPARLALGCQNATILHVMAHNGSNVEMPHYMPVCMPAKIAASPANAQKYWDAYVAYDTCTSDCPQQHTNQIRVGLELENDVPSTELDNVMSYINKAAMACNAATTEAACTDASNSINLMQKPITNTTTSPSVATVATMAAAILPALALFLHG